MLELEAKALIRTDSFASGVVANVADTSALEAGAEVLVESIALILTNEAQKSTYGRCRL